MSKIAIVTINKPSEASGEALLEKLLKRHNNTTLFVKSDDTTLQSHKKTYKDIDMLFSTLWKSHDIIVCFLATGIVVRKIAPYLQSKTTDPAVLIMSFDLKYIIPLLSGHIGGANEFAFGLKELLPELVVFTTTATDQTSTFAFDMFAKQSKFYITNIEKLKIISNCLLNKKPIMTITYPAVIDKIKEETMYKDFAHKKLMLFKDIEDIDNIEDDNIEDSDLPKVIISPFPEEQKRKNNNNLFIQIKDIYIGIGINRDTPFGIIHKALLEFLDKHNLPASNIKALASFEAKSDEVGLIALSKELGKDIYFYDKEEINALEEKLSSSMASHYFGIKGVCEPSSILASSYKTCFIKKQTYFKAVTIAASF